MCSFFHKVEEVPPPGEVLYVPEEREVSEHCCARIGTDRELKKKRSREERAVEPAEQLKGMKRMTGVETVRPGGEVKEAETGQGLRRWKVAHILRRAEPMETNVA